MMSYFPGSLKCLFNSQDRRTYALETISSHLPTHPQGKNVRRYSSLMTPLNPRRGAGQMLMSGWPHRLELSIRRTAPATGHVRLVNTYHHIQSSLRLGRVKRLSQKKKKKMAYKSVNQMADDSELWFVSRLKKGEEGRACQLDMGEKSQRGHGRTEEAREEERCC